jgi:hypothetical protein
VRAFSCRLGIKRCTAGGHRTDAADVVAHHGERRLAVLDGISGFWNWAAAGRLANTAMVARLAESSRFMRILQQR